MKNKFFYRCLFLILVLSFNAFSLNVSKIDDLLKTAYEKGEYSGSVLVAKENRIIYIGGVGLANREWKIPNTRDTKFRINSITKQFTTLLIMQLVEEGKVKLDGTINDYLPDFRKETGEKIQLKHLLLSSSGLPTFDENRFYRGTDKRFTDLDYVLKTFLSGDLTFEPGTKFNYNNGDFMILGAIIEKITGKPFEKVLTEKILKPLGMKNTGIVKTGEILEGLASGYLFSAGKYYKEPFYNIQNYSAAAAMYSTLEDMFLWNKALMENRLLSAENTKRMFTASPQLGFGAFGSWVYDLKMPDGKSYKLVERQGAIGGFSSLNIFSTEEKISLIFLGNVGTGTLFRTYANQGLSYEVLKTLFEK